MNATIMTIAFASATNCCAVISTCNVSFNMELYSVMKRTSTRQQSALMGPFGQVRNNPLVSNDEVVSVVAWVALMAEVAW
jgi:hypothetical protein